MGEGLTITEQRVLAQVLVCGDVREGTLYSISPMLTTSQAKALASLSEKGYLDHTLYRGETNASTK